MGAKCTKIISRGRVHEADRLSGFIAQQGNVRVGLVLYETVRNECEIVSLNSVSELTGVGSLLVDAVKSLRFYQRKGFVLSALHLNVVERSRKLKPEIPITGHDGVPIRDEIELEIRLE
jgi:hypothetical protein